LCLSIIIIIINTSIHKTFLHKQSFITELLSILQFANITMTNIRTLQEDQEQGSGLQQGQTGTETGNQCRIAGDFNKCPASSDFEYAGSFQRLQADLNCPLDSVSQSEYIEASQKGLCECDSALVDKNQTLIKDMECDCYVCPPGSRFGFAYECTSEIAGPCKSFNCFGECNGDMNPLNLDRETFGPTEAPLASGSAVKGLVDPSMGMAVLILALARMIF
jgi:hypothetical protein